jgi:isoleucyl-tRNA synthetase
LRADKTIGSSLDAEVTLYVDDELQKTLAALGQELRFVLITSAASIHNIAAAPDDTIETKITDSAGNSRTIKISAVASINSKCIRCWHHREDVGSDKDHPELCGRCVENVAGDGEQRLFA